MIADYLWLIAVAAGPIILGGAILYALMRSRRLSPAERQDRHAAMQKLYEDGTPERGVQPTPRRSSQT